MNVKETRKLYHDDLRRLCIKNDWYTRGDNEEYGKTLDYAKGLQNVTAQDIATIAADIKAHSETEHTLESICFEIAEICHSFFDFGEGETE
jgi:hypothetical protein